MSEFPPTPEQATALELFATGKSIAIEAFAGTGKTSTLIMLAEAGDARGLTGQYLAFNKAIVSDAAEKFPRSVACNTAHSLAFQAVGKDFRKRLDSSARMKSWDIARLLRIDPVEVVTFMDTKKKLSPNFLAGLAMRSIERFCQTADAEPTYRHVPLIDGLDDPNPHGLRSYAVNNAVGRALEPALRMAWRELRRYNGTLPFKHSHYLKMWQLGDPLINADYILADEAQDLNPVLLAIIEAQNHAQRVYVGDSQQQIYSFTGAVNALQSVPTESRAVLTQSFRFGHAIAEIANTVLDELNAAGRLVGTGSIASTVCPVAEPSAILCRTNAAAVRAVFRALEDGQKPFLVGGGGEIASFARAAQNLMEGKRTEHPELACFETWGEVLEYVEFDEQGDELRLMVKLIDEFGVARILEALGQLGTESAADVVISTAHKSKGREWDSVQLASDFPDQPDAEEKRLLYVAVTRARLELDITAVAFFSDELEPAEPIELEAAL